MDKFNEKNLIEDYFIQKLQEKGWRFVPAEQLERESLDEPLLTGNLIQAMRRINTDLDIGDEEITKVFSELKLVGTGHEGAKKILNYYRFGVPVLFEKDRVVRYVRLFDDKEGAILRSTQDDKSGKGIRSDRNKNEYIITRQVHYSGKDKIRTDIMLYVNGIPLVNIECKDPTKPGGSWYDAFVQIKDYENLVPELYKYVQIGVAAESKAKYFPICSWQKREDLKVHEWRENELDSIDATIEMLQPERLSDIVQNYLFSRLERGEATKVIARYNQYRASGKIVDRVINNLAGHDDKNRGLIWHWQGSGKTLTMIFAAHKLFYHSALGNPSIFFVVDRIDLEDQLYEEFGYLDAMEPEIIHTVEDLEEILYYDEGRGKRGVFIVLIYKFRPEELQNLQKKLEVVSPQRQTVMNRKNIIAFVDEGHRTQYGMLAAQMKKLLKNAFFFAFTGTPISKKGRNTYQEFSNPPQEPYLDRYFVVDSIKDEFTVKIAYQLRLERDVHLKKEMLEIFLEVELDEIPDFEREEVEEKTKKKLNPINAYLENETRISRIAADIAADFKANVAGKFKAMIVAASRNACLTYRREMLKYLSEGACEVVMTEERKRVNIATFVRETRERYEGDNYERIQKKIIENFKESENPQILIVTDMLLTGFDAPILQRMYLDKPLKEHRLLQAVARTNRPYRGIKEAGLIIDYVGILKEFKRAFEIYSKDDIAVYINDLNDLRSDFMGLMADTVKIFSALNGNYTREALLKATEVITVNPGEEKEFVENYRSLRKLFELLGPDEIKLDYFQTFKWLSAVYTYYMKTVMKGSTADTLVEKYLDKTIKYIYKTTEIEEINKDLPEIIFDADYLRNLEEKVKSREEKAANIMFDLQRYILVEKNQSPVYESLTERVQRLIELWREKTKDYDRIYKEGAAIWNDAMVMQARQKRLGLKNMEYALLLVIEQSLGEGDKHLDEIKELSEEIDRIAYPGWIIQATALKSAERIVRRFSRRLKATYNMPIEKMDDLYNKMLGQVKNYGA